MGKVNTQWEHNGHTFEVDIYDLEMSERIQNAQDVMKQDSTEIQKDSLPTAIRGGYNLYVKCFDAIFGEGAGVKIVGDKPNSRIGMEAYISLIEFIQEQHVQNQEMQKHFREKIGKVGKKS